MSRSHAKGYRKGQMRKERNNRNSQILRDRYKKEPVFKGFSCTRCGRKIIPNKMCKCYEERENGYL